MLDQKGRFNSLDSIRGIAAFAVVLDHCWLITSDVVRERHVTIREAFFSLQDFVFYCLCKSHEIGRASVIIFFVLSGFVLSHSLMKQQLPYSQYLIRRLFRIYPILIVLIVVSSIFHLILGSQENYTSSWLRYISTPELSFVIFLKHLALVGTEESNRLLGVIWTLVHEMRISIILPFILMALLRFRLKALAAFGVLSIASTLWFYEITGKVIEGYNAPIFSMTFLNTAYFIVFFAMGSYLALMKDRVTEILSNQKPLNVVIMFCVVFYCLLKTDYDRTTEYGAIVDYLRGFGAVGLIALALGLPRFAATLNHKVFVWLGRISYSLYLIHIPVVYVATHTIARTWTVLETSLLIVVLSLLLAEIATRFIELPGIEMGKKLARKLRERTQQPKTA